MSDPEINDTRQATDFPSRLAKATICYCFDRWLIPLPSGSMMSGPGFPVITSNFTGWTETETDSGDDFWYASVFMKYIDPATNQVLLVTPQILELPHNTYRRTRSRTLAWVGFSGSWFPWAWPAWPAWPAATTGPVNTGSAALAAVNLPECSSCP